MSIREFVSRNSIIVVLAIIAITVITFSLFFEPDSTLREDSPINAGHIRTFMQEQVDLGPRHPGSNGSLAFRNWLMDQIPPGWSVLTQNYTILGVDCRNYLITHESSTSWPNILIGAHYDTRLVADQDDDNPTDPVPGANDAASGVAGILEMLDHMGPLTSITGFVLFDAEDQGFGGMSGWRYIMGSEHFASQMTQAEVDATEIFILYDMIANDDMNMKWEGDSNVTLRESIWDKGHELGYSDIFSKTTGVSLIDDHQPFLDLGIPAVDLIDFTYPEWHTTKDNMDNVSPENAAKVVDTVLEWLMTDFLDIYQIELNDIQTTPSNTSSQLISTTSTTQPSSITSSDTNDGNSSTSDTNSGAVPMIWYTSILGILVLIRKKNRI